MKKNQISRRKFVRSITLASASIPLLSFAGLSLIDRAISKSPFQSSDSKYLKLELTKDSPGFSFFSLDSLGRNKFLLNPITSQFTGIKYRSSVNGMKTEYHFADALENSKPA